MVEKKRRKWKIGRQGCYIFFSFYNTLAALFLFPILKRTERKSEKYVWKIAVCIVNRREGRISHCIVSALKK